MKLVTLEGYDEFDNLGKFRLKKPKLKKLVKSVTKTVKSAAKTVAKNPLKAAVNLAVKANPLVLSTRLALSAAQKAGVPGAKALNKTVNTATNMLSKAALQVTTVVAPAIGTAFGIPPQAMNAVLSVAQGKAPNISAIASQFGVPVENLSAAMALIKAPDTSAKENVLKQVNEKYPELKQNSDKFVQEYSKTVANVEAQAQDKILERVKKKQESILERSKAKTLHSKGWIR